MKILIIGGSKFIGPFIVKKLLNLGHDLTLFKRGLSNYKIPDKLKFIKGDRENLFDFKVDFKALKPDLVIDMISGYEKDASDLISVFDGIVDRIVMISSQDVYLSYGIFLGLENLKSYISSDSENAKLRTVYYPYRDKNFDEDADEWKLMNYLKKS